MEKRKKRGIAVFISSIALGVLIVLSTIYFQEIKASADTVFLPSAKETTNLNNGNNNSTEVTSADLGAVLENKVLSGEQASTKAVTDQLTNVGKELRIKLKPTPTNSGSGPDHFSPLDTNEYYIDIDLSSQVLSLVKDKQIFASYLTSTGKPGMGTPTGTFHVNSKNPMAYTVKYGLYMPYWMAFIGSSHGIHELPIGSRGQEGASHLGHKVSHGCVRLAHGVAGYVYGITPIGTIVYVHD